MLLFSWIYILKTYFFCYLIIRFLVLSRVETVEIITKSVHVLRKECWIMIPLTIFFVQLSNRGFESVYIMVKINAGYLNIDGLKTFQFGQASFPQGRTNLSPDNTRSYFAFELWHFSCVQYGRTIRIIEETTLFSALSLCTHGPSTHLDRK